MSCRATPRLIRILAVWHSDIFTNPVGHWRTLIAKFSGQQFNKLFSWLRVNPFSAGTTFMHMQTGWIQASCRVTRQLACDPTCLPLSLSFPIINKQNLKVLKSRRQFNLFLENYPAFKGLEVYPTHLAPWETPSHAWHEAVAARPLEL